MENSELIIEKLRELAIKIEDQSHLNKQVLSLEEAYKYLRVSKSFLYKLTSSKKIACYKPNHKLIFFKREDLDNWRLQNRRPSIDEVEKSADQFSIKKTITNNNLCQRKL